MLGARFLPPADSASRSAISRRSNSARLPQRPDRLLPAESARHGRWTIARRARGLNHEYHMPSFPRQPSLQLPRARLVTPSRAEIDYPWCSLSSTGQSGTPACRFSTREQCQASIGGMAGFASAIRVSSGRSSNNDEARRAIGAGGYRRGKSHAEVSADHWRCGRRDSARFGARPRRNRLSVVRDDIDGSIRQAVVRVCDARTMPGVSRRSIRLLRAQCPHRCPGAERCGAPETLIYSPQSISKQALARANGQFLLACLLSARHGIRICRTYLRWRGFGLVDTRHWPWSASGSVALHRAGLPKRTGPSKATAIGPEPFKKGYPTMKTSLLSLSATAFVAIAATVLASSPSRAEAEYPWCAITSTGQSGTPNCYYATLDQCKAFLSGQAGFCQSNPRATAQAQVPRRGAR